ncbi:hypothetical protein T492DRAFT_859132 [Pavlovales sp. CCMP2436]|nr:hypothetical protein T492DRAFT_859132 [Pavlovales sp. CCMP2436]
MVFGFASGAAAAPTSVHSFTVKNLAGKDLSLATYRGKPVLIENVASLHDSGRL